MVLNKETLDVMGEIVVTLNGLLEDVRSSHICPRVQKKPYSAIRQTADMISLAVRNPGGKDMKNYVKFTQIGTPAEVRMTRTRLWNQMRIGDDGWLYIDPKLGEMFSECIEADVPEVIAICRNIKEQIGISLAALEARQLDETDAYKALAQKENEFRRKLKKLENTWAMPFSDWLVQKGIEGVKPCSAIWTSPDQHSEALTHFMLGGMGLAQFNELWAEYALNAPWKILAYTQDASDLKENEKDIAVLVRRIIEVPTDFMNNTIEEEVPEVEL